MRLYLLVLIFCLSMSTEAEDRPLLVLGDSISAGYGIALNQGWVHLLQQRLDNQGYRYKVINASISGDTTRGARARLGKILSEHRPVVSLIELGGNDGLRGLSIEEMSTNLAVIIQELKKCDSKIVLVPMLLPPNYGKVYNTRFEKLYQELASSYDIVLGEFILQDIADKPNLMQSDGIHPRAEAQSLMLDNVWPSLQALLK